MLMLQILSFSVHALLLHLTTGLFAYHAFNLHSWPTSESVPVAIFTNHFRVGGLTNVTPTPRAFTEGRGDLIPELFLKKGETLSMSSVLMMF